MAYALQVYERLQALNIEEEVIAILKNGNNEKILADATRFQLSEGKNREGGYLPRYIDDPYFSSLEGALAYQEWKASISPGDEKPEEVMDFFIRGDFYKTIESRVTGNTIDTFSWSNIADDVMQKTDNKALGINPESARRLWFNMILPVLLKRITAKTGIQFIKAA